MDEECYNQKVGSLLAEISQQWDHLGTLVLNLSVLVAGKSRLLSELANTSLKGKDLQVLLRELQLEQELR